MKKATKKRKPRKLSLPQLRKNYQCAGVALWIARFDHQNIGAVLLMRLLEQPPTPKRDAEMERVLDSLGAD